jgi:hypothetical protein
VNVDPRSFEVVDDLLHPGAQTVDARSHALRGVDEEEHV